MDININIQTTQFNELGEKNIIKTNSDGTLYQKMKRKWLPSTLKHYQNQQLL